MDLQAEKIELIRQLIETESIDVINRIKSVFRGEEYDFYDDLPENVKADIEIALKEIEEGDTLDHDIVMNDFKARYGSKN